MDLVVKDQKFDMTINTLVHLEGYIGCTKNSMLGFFLHLTPSLDINRTLSLHRVSTSYPSTYYFLQDDVKVHVSDDVALRFLSEIGQHVLA